MRPDRCSWAIFVLRPPSRLAQEPQAMYQPPLQPPDVCGRFFGLLSGRSAMYWLLSDSRCKSTRHIRQPAARTAAEARKKQQWPAE